MTRDSPGSGPRGGSSVRSFGAWALVLALLLASACGRIAFETPDEAGVQGMRDGPAPDAGDASADGSSGDAGGGKAGAPGPGAPVGEPDPVDPGRATHVVSLSTETADCADDLSDVAPGDVVALESGTRGALEIANCHGERGNPIVFVNDGGVVRIEDDGSVYAGLDIRDSSYIRVSGSGAPGGEGRTVGSPYPEDEQNAGIRISGTERGVAFRYLEVFEEMFPEGGVVEQGLQLDHLEAGPTSKKGFHGPESTRLGPEYTVVGFHLHHNYVHDNDRPPDGDGQCFGLGSGNYPDLTADTGQLEIDHNLCARSGRDGIQVANAWYGDNRIHHNLVRDVGQGESQDSFGIELMPGSAAEVFGNYVFDSGRDGIRDQGINGSRYFNNVIVRGGHFTTSSSRGIHISSNRSDAPAEHLEGNEGGAKIWHNTIVGFPDSAIHFTNGEGADANEARNNVLWDSDGAITTASDTEVAESNNLGNDPGFVDAGGDDYRIGADSPARDAGDALEGLVDVDIRGVDRPQGAGWDLGAYEVRAP